MKVGLTPSCSVTVPVCTFWSGPTALPASDTVCEEAPVLVTLTWKVSAVPGASMALSWFCENSSVLPDGAGAPSPVLIDCASSTAL